MRRDDSVEKMIERYKRKEGLEPDAEMAYDYYYFSNNEKDAEALAELTKTGGKRATTSIFNIYEWDKEPLPEVGEVSVIINISGDAQCVIKVTKVTVMPFLSVDETYALREGEGDKTLKYWREAHLMAFNAEMKEYGKKFNTNMKVVCEEFEVVYKET